MKLVLALCLAAFTALAAEKEIVLWPAGAPDSEARTEPEKVDASGNVTSIHKPSITPFLPAADKANGAAVLVIPGGGHSKLCTAHEGVNVAQWLADHGVAAFMLKHRLAREAGSTYAIEIHALADTQRALRLIRSRASQWNIDPARLGAIGFSAGGELVNLASLRPGEGKADSADPIERENARPNFQALIYPGRSGDIVPTKDAPPAFLACSTNDRQDISEGLAEAYLRFKRAGANAELHIYATGAHGFGLRAGMKMPVAGWADRFEEWMESKGFLVAKK